MVADMQQFGLVWPQCVARAWEDDEFREALKSDPAGTLLKAFQFLIPSGIQLQVVDGNEAVEAQPTNTLRMTIPPKPELDMQEVALVENKDDGKKRLFPWTATAC
jgi:ribosomally synthesized peptide (two-chain TOMM family)